MLQLGGTLKRGEGCFVLDLSEPDAHKTAKKVGPSRQTLGKMICEQLTTYISLMPRNAVAKPYLFAEPGTDHGAPLEMYSWTRLIKFIFKRHSGLSSRPVCYA